MHKSKMKNQKKKNESKHFLNQVKIIWSSVVLFNQNEEELVM